APQGALGGGIYNQGTLTVSSSTLSGNSSGGGVLAGGGGVCNGSTGKLTLSYCTVSSNRGFQGGGIYNDGSLTVSNTTLFDNSGGFAGGGGMYNSTTGTLMVSFSTFSHNGNNEGSGGGI